MIYLLDTDICIHIIRHKPIVVLQKLNSFTLGEIGISSITAAELFVGVEKSQQPAQNRHALVQFLLPLEIAPFDDVAAVTYGQVRATLERQGTPIGALDTLIAAHALSRGWTLVTNNVREFGRVDGLVVDNWLSVTD